MNHKSQNVNMEDKQLSSTLYNIKPVLKKGSGLGYRACKEGQSSYYLYIDYLQTSRILA